MSGDPVPLVEGLPAVSGFGRVAFSASQTGTLIYRAGSTPIRRWTWLDRSGKGTEIALEPRSYAENFDLSDDDSQVAASVSAGGGSRSDVWIIDLSRRVASRLTHDERAGPSGRDVVWSPDGSRLAYTSYAKTSQDIVVKRADGLGQEELLAGSPNSEFIEDWSRDGKYLVYGAWAPTPTDVWALNLSDRKPFPVLQSSFRKDEPHFSPDGKWLAYASEESGRWEIYVVSFPRADQKRQISNNGGAQPRWRRDGKELFYLSLDAKFMAVDVATAAERISSGTPRVLFETGIAVNPTVDQYDSASDGQRFLMLKEVNGTTPEEITVVVNWPASLKKSR